LFIWIVLFTRNFQMLCFGKINKFISVFNYSPQAWSNTCIYLNLSCSFINSAGVSLAIWSLYGSSPADETLKFFPSFMSYNRQSKNFYFLQTWFIHMQRPYVYLFIFVYRQYEEKQLKTQQERAQRRLEFSNQESKLKSQVWFVVSPGFRKIYYRMQKCIIYMYNHILL
jgi:hypothetical protein